MTGKLDVPDPDSDADGSGSPNIPGAMPELPAPGTIRWTVRRKAAVAQAVRRGWLSLDEACQRYDLSAEEFQNWERAIERHGIPGLRITRSQLYRETEKKRENP